MESVSNNVPSDTIKTHKPLDASSVLQIARLVMNKKIALVAVKEHFLVITSAKNARFPVKIALKDQTDALIVCYLINTTARITVVIFNVKSKINTVTLAITKLDYACLVILDLVF